MNLLKRKVKPEPEPVVEPVIELPSDEEFLRQKLAVEHGTHEPDFSGSGKVLTPEEKLKASAEELNKAAGGVPTRNYRP